MRERYKRRKRYTGILRSARTRAKKTRERGREEKVLAGKVNVGRGGVGGRRRMEMWRG